MKYNEPLLTGTMYYVFPGMLFLRERTHRERQRERQATKLSLALSLENLGVRTGSVRACVRQIGMASYSLKYGIIFIRI